MLQKVFSLASLHYLTLTVASFQLGQDVEKNADLRVTSQANFIEEIDHTGHRHIKPLRRVNNNDQRNKTEESKILERNNRLQYPILKALNLLDDNGQNPENNIIKISDPNIEIQANSVLSMLEKLATGEFKPKEKDLNQAKLMNRYHKNLAEKNDQSFDRYLGPHGKGGKNEHAHKHSLLMKAIMHSNEDQDLEALYDMKDNLRFAKSFIKNRKNISKLTGNNKNVISELEDKKILFDVIYKSIQKGVGYKKNVRPRAFFKEQKKRQGGSEGELDILKDQKEFFKFAQLLK